MVALAGCASSPQKPVERYVSTAWQSGVTVADEPHDYTSTKACELYAHLKTIGVRWVALTPGAFIFDVNKPSIRWHEHHNIGAAIDSLHALGIATTLKPYLWSSQFYREGKWTGDIQMASDEDWSTFFQNYDAFILQYAKIAEEHHAEMLCIGLELPKTLIRATDWEALIFQVRAVYHGMLTYAAAGVDEAFKVPFWSEMDFVGVNAYPSLSDKESPSEMDLCDGWMPIEKQLDSLSRMVGKKILFTEAGYRSSVGAAYKPWEWVETNRHPVDLKLQELCYEALCDCFFSKPWFAGIYWWKYYATPDAGGSEDDDFTPQNKPAEQVMANWFEKMDTVRVGNGIE